VLVDERDPQSLTLERDTVTYSEDDSVQDIGVSHESRGERGAWLAVEPFRLSDLLDPSTVHQDDPAGHHHRFFLIMGEAMNVFWTASWMARNSSCIDCRTRRSSAESGSSRRSTEGSGASARARATRCCWPPESSSGRRSPYPPRRTRSSISATRCSILRWHPLQAETEGYVLVHGQMGKEGVALEQHVQWPALRRRVGDIVAIDPDPTGRRTLEPCDDPKQRRLAATARAEQRQEFTSADFEIDIIEGNHSPELLPKRGHLHDRMTGSGICGASRDRLAIVPHACP
jgi:hypothetical protein